MGSPRPLPILHTPTQSPFEGGRWKTCPYLIFLLRICGVQTLPRVPPLEASLRRSVKKTQCQCHLCPRLVQRQSQHQAPVLQLQLQSALEKNSGGKHKPKEPKQKHKWLTALQEIRKLQTSFEDILPFAPFARLVRELCRELVKMRFTKKAIQALRSSTEAYLLEIFEKANLACWHAGRCTLQPKDIRFVSRVLDHDVTMGSSEEAIQGWQKDILKDRPKRIT